MEYARYYLTDLATFRAHPDLGNSIAMHQDPSESVPFADLPLNSQIVAKILFKSPAHRERWEALPNVESLPDPLKHQAIKPPQIAKLLKHGVKDGDTTFDAIDQLIKRNRGFAFEVK
jgi:hypothetical protein